MPSLGRSATRPNTIVKTPAASNGWRNTHKTPMAVWR